MELRLSFLKKCVLALTSDVPSPGAPPSAANGRPDGAEFSTGKSPVGPDMLAVLARGRTGGSRGARARRGAHENRSLDPRRTRLHLLLRVRTRSARWAGRRRLGGAAGRAAGGWGVGASGAP
eukprot:364347-Chlamydomonas_euryale.AAC.19